MVASVVQLTDSKKHIQQINRVFASQKAAFRSNPMPTCEERKDNLKRLKKALLRNQSRLIEAINQDFSCRAEDETMLAEIMPSIEGINYTLKNVAKWMKPSKRHVGLLFQPAKNTVYYQPLGVVGVIVPWNYPLYLAVGPLVAALAAGNRVMIKMSEYTPHTSTLFANIIAECFPENMVSVINGDADVAVEFSRVKFDHMLFTGSTAVGRHVMRAAAENLTPVTLELGGKSPAVIASTVPMDDAAERLVFGKAFNAGQTCVAPDYVLCPKDRVEQFVESFQRKFGEMFSTLKHNNDFTSIVDERQHARLQKYIDDAQKKGATVIAVNPANEDMQSDTRKMPIHLIINPTDNMLVMQEEIFGPILPVIAYEQLDDAIDYINDRPRPLAMYYFGYDKKAQQYLLDHTHSGGACINDTLVHVAQDDLPFGGVGDSGMGHYHGHEGFLTFTNHRGVYSKQKFNTGKLIFPPYGTAIHKLIYSVFVR
ncbi:MAG: coniferyl aldehyde dehydrogenase [Pseudomonadales bacterium]|uniref:Aldehyde dehydrogenase n=1 Tax=Oleiphilus messinensis TaxID=141451 RepID=A0A1Y0IGN3_9GAMM|nr:coniferyl aldehyde dehydrogenase [Oleiphilus messinensis]ARU58573.1 aldehyde dehydrogenase [Oleiphilus messinensis]MCG8610450.1 coniferyl aldehyde dehydrogenase [Pseudomonadales bacterium]